MRKAGDSAVEYLETPLAISSFNSRAYRPSRKTMSAPPTTAPASRAIVLGCERLYQEAVRIGIISEDACAEILEVLGAVVDEAKKDKTRAVTEIKKRAALVPKDTVYGCTLQGVLRTFEKMGGFETHIDNNIKYIEELAIMYRNQKPVITNLIGNHGRDFLPYSQQESIPSSSAPIARSPVKDAGVQVRFESMD